jgi:hypothetical protein
MKRRAFITLRGGAAASNAVKRKQLRAVAVTARYLSFR